MAMNTTAAPYTVFEGGVNAAAITGTIPAATIGNGTITSSMLAPGAAAANLAASDQGGVPSGGMVLSVNYNDGNLMNGGYVSLGHFDMGEGSQQCASGSPPARAATARPRSRRWGKTARNSAIIACSRPQPGLAGWGRNE
jgi:hypothetical protein